MHKEVQVSLGSLVKNVRTHVSPADLTPFLRKQVKSYTHGDMCQGKGAGQREGEELQET